MLFSKNKEKAGEGPPPENLKLENLFLGCPTHSDGFLGQKAMPILQKKKTKATVVLDTYGGIGFDLKWTVIITGRICWPKLFLLQNNNVFSLLKSNDAFIHLSTVGMSHCQRVHLHRLLFPFKCENVAFIEPPFPPLHFYHPSSTNTTYCRLKRTTTWNQMRPPQSWNFTFALNKYNRCTLLCTGAPLLNLLLLLRSHFSSLVLHPFPSSSSCQPVFTFPPLTSHILTPRVD